MTYQEQLNHPEWQKKRLEVLEDNDFACSECGTRDKQLHVHHTIYKKGHKIWEYGEDELVCLCSDCHENIHLIDSYIKETMTFFSSDMKLTVLGFMDAMLSPNIRFPDNINYMKGYVDEIRNNDLYISNLLKRS